ncbi:MAG: hypothetical protein AAF489_11030 [Bacteroidota bacterium]
MEYVVKTYDDLLQLGRAKNEHFEHIQLDEHFHKILGKTEAKKWEHRLERDLFDCGCSSGALAMISAGFLGLAYLFILRDTSEINKAVLPVILILVFLAGVAGKVAGLYRAKQRLKRNLLVLGNLCFGPFPSEEHESGQYRQTN